MRSRYSAFALGQADYLRRSWHPDTCPTTVRNADDQVWVGLEVTDARGGAFDTEGEVEFIAHYERNGTPGQLHERSRFVRHEGRWVYLDATEGVR